MRKKIEGQSPQEIEEKIKNSLDKFWSKNREKLENENYNDEEINEEDNNKNKKKTEEEINKIKKEKAQKAQKLLVDHIRNENMGISTPELPKISLFNQNEKKILLNVLPEKEIEKFEKRYDALDNAKNNLKRKFALETKSLDKENKDLEKRYEFSVSQLKENERKNKLLLVQVNEQKNEVFALRKKLQDSIKYLNDSKLRIQEKDEENRNLVKQLEELRMKYIEAPVKKEDQENEENNNEENDDNLEKNNGEENENEEKEHNENSEEEQ